MVFDSPQQRSRCGVIFYTHPRRVTPKPFVQTATSSLHFTPHVTLHIQHYRNTLRFSEVTPENPTAPTNTQTHYRLKVFTFHPTAPTSHSQWSSRSTEYTRRSRTCRPEATGSCRNSAVRAWASSRWESLRTSYCKWGADKSLETEGKKTFGKVLVLWTIADLVTQCKPKRAPRRCCLLCTQHRDQERGYD